MNEQQTLDIAIDLISKLESFESTPYRDQVGILTIGFGTTQIDGRKVTMLDHCTQAQALCWLKSRLETDFQNLTSFCMLHDIDLQDNQAATILSFTYNAGWNAFLNSSMAKDLIAEKFEKVTTDLLKWNKIRQDDRLVFSPGLFNRRMEEALCFVDEKGC